MRQLHAGPQRHLHEVQHLRIDDGVQLMAEYSFKGDPRISDWQREKLREFCSTLDGDIAALARSFGLKVLKEDLLPYERGSLENAPSYGSATGWVIKVNERDEPEKINFTVGHELGHFVLHSQQLADAGALDGRINRNTQDAMHPFQYLDERDKQMEAEANLFAATLLMPPNLFKPAFDRLGGNIEALAKLFFVTEVVVKRRIRELEL
jgi:Zn-dependent peptidase ImmA (M78 family)